MTFNFAQSQNLVGSHVTTTVERLQRSLLEGHSSTSRAHLARMRRGTSSQTFDPTVTAVAFTDLPAELVGRSDDLSYAERSILSALSLYSVHQQSQSTAMHRRGRGFGQAIRDLIRLSPAEDYESSPVIRRYNALITSDSPDELLWHMRGLINQLRAAGISLDYGQLAEDLFSYHFDRPRRGVRLAWSRDLYAQKPSSETPTEATSEHTA